MVATDTVVGIVGSVILVAVMAGVFVYEYNNTEEGGSDARLVDFQEAYPALVPNQDLDGDGTQNYLDDDLDGDGVNNTDDAEIQFVEPFSGSLGPASPASSPAFTYALNLSAGNHQIVAFVNYTALFPAPAPLVPAFQVALLDANGETVATGVSTASGTTVTVRLEAEAQVQGAYTLGIRQGAAGPGGAFSGIVLVHYESGAA